jgi:hypothetical protein
MKGSRTRINPATCPRARKQITQAIDLSVMRCDMRTPLCLCGYLRGLPVRFSGSRSPFSWAAKPGDPAPSPSKALQPAAAPKVSEALQPQPTYIAEDNDLDRFFYSAPEEAA